MEPFHFTGSGDAKNRLFKTWSLSPTRKYVTGKQVEALHCLYTNACFCPKTILPASKNIQVNQSFRAFALFVLPEFWNQSHQVGKRIPGARVFSERLLSISEKGRSFF